MCGIAGIVHFDKSEIEPKLIEVLHKSLIHRGPDDFGFLGWSGVSKPQITRHHDEIRGNRVSLIHNRLSILDLSQAGWQPMGTQDGRFYIIFNGEIYNYIELRTELKLLGNIFQSNSDTEVLLCAYAQWGTNMLTKLIGMFAFVILDTHKSILFLARDFFGIKPLYYTYQNNRFAFASEIKTLLEIPGVKREVNPESLYFYLRYGLTDIGEPTLFKNINQLPPAHYLEIPINTTPYNLRPQRYWDFPVTNQIDISFKEAATHIQELFLKNIQLHLRSDVAIGATLSGGIDSSAIVMAMNHLCNSKSFHSFSYIAEKSSLNEECWINIVNTASNSIVHKIKINENDLATDINHLISIQDEPFGSSSIYAQYKVFQKVQDTGIKVVLTGQGADELLGGYQFYISARLSSLLRSGKIVDALRLLNQASHLPGIGKLQILSRMADFILPSKLQAPIRNVIGKNLAPPWLNIAWFNMHGVLPTPLNYTTNRSVLMNTIYNTLSKTSLPHLLRYEDRNSMAFSIESRLPFLTPQLVHFILSLPEEYIIDINATSKAVFRQAMKGIVPDAILARKDKIGFSTPEEEWVCKLTPWVENTLKSALTAQFPCLNQEEMLKEWRKILNKETCYHQHVWHWINFIKWAEHFKVSF